MEAFAPRSKLEDSDALESESESDIAVDTNDSSSDEAHVDTSAQTVTNPHKGGAKRKPKISLEDEYASLKSQVVEMTFEEREKFKQKVGLKMYKKIMKGGVTEPETLARNKTFKRENKNRPMEISSKKRPSRLREVVQVKKKHHRDPRFDDLSGEFDERLFRQSYGFISDIKKKEKTVLAKKLAKEKNDEKKEQIKSLLKKMDQEEAVEKKKTEQLERLSEIKRKEKELVKEGKTPFYLKNSDKKKLELAEKFRELKKSGKIEKYMQSKRKRNAGREKRKLPNK